jgi:hypothetical protein
MGVVLDMPNGIAWGTKCRLADAVKGQPQSRAMQPYPHRFSNLKTTASCLAGLVRPALCELKGSSTL